MNTLFTNLVGMIIFLSSCSEQPLAPSAVGVETSSSQAGIDANGQNKKDVQLKALASVIYEELDKTVPEYYTGYSSVLLRSCTDDLIGSCVANNNCMSIEDNGADAVALIYDHIEVCLEEQKGSGLVEIVSLDITKGVVASIAPILDKLNDMHPTIDFFSNYTALLNSVIEVNGDLSVTHLGELTSIASQSVMNHSFVEGAKKAELVSVVGEVMSSLALLSSEKAVALLKVTEEFSKVVSQPQSADLALDDESLVVAMSSVNEGVAQYAKSLSEDDRTDLIGAVGKIIFDNVPKSKSNALLKEYATVVIAVNTSVDPFDIEVAIEDKLGDVNLDFSDIDISTTSSTSEGSNTSVAINEAPSIVGLMDGQLVENSSISLAFTISDDIDTLLCSDVEVELSDDSILTADDIGISGSAQECVLEISVPAGSVAGTVAVSVSLLDTLEAKDEELIQIQIQDIDTPTNPSNLSLLTPEAKSIELSFDAGTGTTVDHVIAYQSGSTAPSDCESGTIVELDAEETSFTITELSDGTDYAFRVCSRNNDDPKEYSVGIVGTTQTSAAFDQSDLLIWLDATDPSGDGSAPSADGALATWVNKAYSNGDHDGIAPDGYQPTWRSNQKNGLPTVLFDSAYLNFDSMATDSAPIFRDDNMDMTIITALYLAAETDNGHNRQLFSAHSASGGNHTRLGLANQVMVSWSGVGNSYVSSTYTGGMDRDGEWFVMSFRSIAAATEFEVRQNGERIGSHVAASYRMRFQSTTEKVTIGAEWDGTDSVGDYLNGEMGEYIMLNREVGDAELVEFESYLAEKWGISLVE